MPVFSLKEAKELQVKNVSENTFKYWGESAIYGYYGGGVGICLISRLDFSNETLSNQPRGLPIASGYAAAVANNFYGYFAGGTSPSYTTGQVMQISSVQRFELSNETFSNPGRNLPTELQNAGAVSNPNNSYGYFGGGYRSLYLGATTVYNTISRLDFTNETISLPGKNFSTTRTGTAGVYNQTYGYFGGSGCVISRLDFTSETLSEPSSRYLPTNRSLSGAVSNISYGYFGGGFIPTPPFYSSTISRLEFSTETVSDPGKNFYLGIFPGPDFSRYANAGVSASSAGYFGGGFVSPPSASGTLSIITRIDFGTETLSNLSQTFLTNRTSMASFSGGQSIYRGSKTYGYFGGGYAPTAVCVINRLDFASETISTPIPQLSTTRAFFAGVSNNYYGYFASRFPANQSRIDRLDFSNDSISVPVYPFSPLRSNLAATSSSSYGYFGGGYSPGGQRHSTITRIDFFNETAQLLPTVLSAQRYNLFAVSSSSFCYFSDGFSPVGVYCSIDRLDFSTETNTLLTPQLPYAKESSATVSTSGYGYFAGGAPATNQTRRLEFSNETTSTILATLPTTTFNAAGSSSSFYGYIAGGSTPTAVCNINRLDFSAETISIPTSKLTQPKIGLAAVSNSN